MWYVWNGRGVVVCAPDERNDPHETTESLTIYWSSTDPTDSPKLQEKEKEA
jgi:hypothetical protein